MHVSGDSHGGVHQENDHGSNYQGQEGIFNPRERGGNSETGHNDHGDSYGGSGSPDGTGKSKCDSSGRGESDNRQGNGKGNGGSNGSGIGHDLGLHKAVPNNKRFRSELSVNRDDFDLIMLDKVLALQGTTKKPDYSID
jgi:hypothetical protein